MRTFRSGALGSVGVLCVALWARWAPAGGQPLRLPLLKGWRVKPAADAGKLADKFFRADFDDSTWKTTDITPGKPQYTARYILYRRWVQVPAAWRGKRVQVVFKGVDDDAVVWLNGRKLGEHKGWNEAFSFDVSGALNYGGRNLLAVFADNSGGGAAGIWQPVELVLAEEIARLKAEQEAKLRKELKALPFKIVFETRRNGNWELFMVNADGSNPVNLTRTPDINELYPHVSPDGKRVCFVVDEGKGAKKVRSVYYMNLDGTGRTLVARNARQPCWSPDGTRIAYLKGEFERFSYSDFATKGIVIYDLKTGQHHEHPNKSICHLYNICWTPDGKWFISTVHAGMGFKHGILALEAAGQKVFNLGIPGCRPDVSPDGRLVAWGASDWALRCGRLDFSGPKPRVVDQRDMVTSRKPMKIYHVDWSPDGRYVAFSRGPSRKRLGYAPEMVGIPAEGWNICVADATTKNRWIAITTDGNCNKEPDWVPVAK